MTSTTDLIPVTDPDEEIFILYSELQGHVQDQATFRGLGYLDNHKDVLDITFEIKGTVSAPAPQKGTKKRKPAKTADRTIEITLHQDKTALRSRKGDTGSVVWKASVDFAQLVLQQYYYSSPSSPSPSESSSAPASASSEPPSAPTPTPTLNTLFTRDRLSAQTVLELGAGTGLLAVALSPLVKHYTATDIGALIPLIKKNVASNLPSPTTSASVSVSELDWVTIHTASSPAQRKKIYDPSTHPIDLLLLVDCLYHPSLIPPCLATIDFLATPGRTEVLVVSELRAEDVLREFLDKWLAYPGWHVWRVPSTDLGRNYVVWLGRKSLEGCQEG